MVKHSGVAHMTMNIAIVGLGKMGILHSGIVNSLNEARVKAICEKNGFLVKTAKALLPKATVFYKDHVKMLENEELDAVFVTTPISSHVSIVQDLVRANRDVSVFVEKPLASSHEEAKMACDGVGNLRGIHMVGFQKRFSPIFRKAKEIIASGLLDRPIFLRAYSFSSDVLREGGSWRFRSGTGGVLLDLAPHLLDILLWYFGEPTAIAAVKSRVYSSEVDDYVHAVLSFKSGLRGHLDTCWSVRSSRLPEISIEIYAKNGMLTVTDDFIKLRLEKGDGVERSQVYHKQSFDNSVSFLLADPEFTREDEAFLAAVRKRSMPELNFFEAAKVNALIDRINKNAE
jgi:predicted dehydrogenase